MSDLSIGASILAKDCADTVADTIKSLYPLISQIVVIDTGSVDSTPSVCTKLGAEVYYRKWRNDFSDPRNFSLDMLRTEWIISIDSDEVLDLNSLVNEIDLLNNEEIGGIRVKLVNYMQSGITSDHYYTRLFRNHKSIRYAGRVHEQINQSILDQGYKIVDSDIAIHHFGYSENNSEKFRRNRELIELEIKDKGNDEWLLYHLAETYFAEGLTEKATEIFTKIEKSDNLSVKQQEMSRLRLTQAALKEHRFSDIDALTDTKFSDENYEGLRLFIKLISLMLRKDFNSAKQIAQSPEIAASGLVDKNHYASIKSILGIE